MKPVFFSKNIPSLNSVFSSTSPHIKQALVFCDKKLKNHPSLKKWKKNKNVKFYYLPSGEKTKSLEKLPFHIQKILKLNPDFDKKSLGFISLGGGSLGDLTGFLASIYKRGLPVIHFPTTWLSALDSAHGGKTAINFQNIKNLLGTFHFPKGVFVVESLLNQNPDKQKREAFGELLKIAFIEGGTFYQKLSSALRTHSQWKAKNQSSLKKGSFPIEKWIKPAIRAKMKIIQKDPFEKKDLRKKLNLGHSLGHLLESLYPLPHGLAVEQGLLFSLNWSFYKGFIPEKYFKEMKEILLQKKPRKKINPALFKKHLRQDKKHRQGYKLDFVFIKRPGSVLIKKVSEKDFLKEARRQGFI